MSPLITMALGKVIDVVSKRAAARGRIKEAKEEMTAMLLTCLRKIQTMDDDKMQEEAKARVGRQIRAALINGEVEIGQHEMLLGVLATFS